MQGSQLDVLKGCLHCLQQGEQVTLVSVANTWGTSPRPIGSLLAVSSSGRFYGSVSGGCVEEDLIHQLTQQPIKKVTKLKYGETEAERHRFGLPCGGALELIAEPIVQIKPIAELINDIEIRRTQVRSVSLNTGHVTLEPWQHQDAELTQDHWVNVFGPTWRLFIVGAGETGRYLAEFAQGLGFEILVSDPRPDYRMNWPLQSVPLLEGFPDDLLDAMTIDRRTAIVTVAHDPKVDDMALLSALHSDAFYIGALGSKANNQQRRQRLVEHFAFTQTQVNRLHGPVGLNIGSKSPPEIALSILAEITAIKNGILPSRAMAQKESIDSETDPCTL